MSNMRVVLMAVACLSVFAASCSQAATPAGTNVGTPAATTKVQPAPAQFTLVSTGDFISQPPLSEQAARDGRQTGKPHGDFSRILGAVKPMVSKADLAICHMETPVAAPGDPWTGYPIFNAPLGLVETAAAFGYDSCSTASNHVFDYGEAGLARTLDALDRAGVKHAGSARTPQEAASPTIVDVRGVKVGHLSYTFSFNGIPLPEGKPWMSNLIDVPVILAEAHRAREAGAEAIVVSMHWGTEYHSEVDDGQKGIAAQLLASPDIDLIIGTHVHVVQPLERIGDKWVQYGMGNILVRFPDGSPEETQDAMAARFTFTKGADGWRVSKVEVAPTWMEYEPVARVVDLTTELARADLGQAQHATYQRAYDRIVRWVTSREANISMVATS
jgi:poly-gamma-glutamate synthesis protein (capsule biosynthesis protein)